MSDAFKTRIAKLSDAELYALINSVCASVGLDAKKAHELTSDIPKLRRMLGSLSDKQISALIGSLGSNDVSDAKKKLF